MFRATVALTRCPTYSRDRVREAVGQALDLLPATRDLPRAGGRVLLKPNLLSPNDPPERAVNTHPEFIRAVAEWFAGRGWRVLIGDSCGSLSPGSTAKAIRATGVDRVAAETGAEVVNFDLAPVVERPVPHGRVLPKVDIPQVVGEVDLFVTLPKLKTHGLTLLTGAVKNQMGLVRGKGKKDIHSAAPKPVALAHALLDIHSVAPPHLAVMDAVVAMEGNGPEAGAPRSVGAILAGDDCAAVDAAAAELVGFRAEEVDTTRLAEARGLGVGRMEEVRLLGEPLGALRVRDFRRPPHYAASAFLNLFPSRLLRWAMDEIWSCYATVNQDRCKRCGECVANCPTGAMHRVEDRVEADRRRCIGCYCCSEVCQYHAIEMARPLAGRVVQALARGRRGPDRGG